MTLQSVHRDFAQETHDPIIQFNRLYPEMAKANNLQIQTIFDGAQSQRECTQSIHRESRAQSQRECTQSIHRESPAQSHRECNLSIHRESRMTLNKPVLIVNARIEALERQLNECEQLRKKENFALQEQIKKLMLTVHQLSEELTEEEITKRTQTESLNAQHVMASKL